MLSVRLRLPHLLTPLRLSLTFLPSRRRIRPLRLPDSFPAPRAPPHYRAPRSLPEPPRSPPHRLALGAARKRPRPRPTMEGSAQARSEPDRRQQPGSVPARSLPEVDRKQHQRRARVQSTAGAV